MNILSIDCGTQSLRAIIFSSNGEMLAKVKVDYDPPYYSKDVDYAEQDPYFYWNTLCKATTQLSEMVPELFSSIIGVTLTTQRATTVVLDKHGEPVRNAILWLDQRLAQGRPNFTWLENLGFSIIGMKDAAEKAWRRSTANYMRQHEPELWSKVDKYLLLSGFLTYKLTDHFVDSVASQVGYIPFDYKHNTWFENPKHYKWRMFGIEREKLPDLVKPTELLGYITKEAAAQTKLREGLPVIAAGADKMCETLAIGCFSPDVGSISLGTTATIETTFEKYIEILPFMPPYPSIVPDRYNPEVEIFRGYWLISWFMNELAEHEVIEAREMGIPAEDLLDRRLQNIPAGSEGLIVHPTWTPGLDKAFSRGAIIGFSDKHTRIHIYRALIEGVNFGLIEGKELIEKKTKVQMKKIGISGGGAVSDEICQITSNMFGVPVYRVQTSETSSLGAAIAGCIGLKEYPDVETAVKSMVHISKQFVPDLNEHSTYKKIYTDIYKELWQTMKPLYYKISKLKL